MLLITEAGGTIATFDNKPLPMGKKCSVVAGTPAACKDFFRIVPVDESTRPLWEAF